MGKIEVLKYDILLLMSDLKEQFSKDSTEYMHITQTTTKAISLGTSCIKLHRIEKILLKFRFSKKATKFETISHMI